ncbi:adenine-specific DNA methylase [Lysinibacillus sphaericus]|nr:adenine-specific DNA methylase [Lysinibacillus sphaericus]
MERSWNMPNKNTFEIKSIRELLKDELKGGLIIDPFANRNNYGHITNDLNEKYDTDFHMDALDFLRMFPDESVDVVLFDPPYSPRQVKEAYESVGLNTKGGRLTQASYWSDLKKEIARVLRIGGKSISFGWNSGGMNNKELFHINRIQLVAHGGNHNDTIVTVSVKKFSKIPEKKNDSRFDSKVNKQLSLF